MGTGVAANPHLAFFVVAEEAGEVEVEWSDEKAPAPAWESEELLSLSAYVAHQSKGMPIETSTDGPARAAFERGRHLYSLQRRLRACYYGVRAAMPEFGSSDLVALELYLAARARGLVSSSPGVRK